MKTRRIAALALSAALALTLTAPALAEENTAALASPEAAAQAAGYAMAYGGATAVQYAVSSELEPLFSGHAGVYSKTEDRALADTDLFGIGSISKIYTTAAVLKLVDQGKVDLDAPVKRYLPDFKMADERYEKITVRMLLNHSSGLMGGSTNDAFLFADDDQTATTDLLARLSKQWLKADPGEIAVYCNDGFTLAELVVEAVSGQSFGQFLRVNLLAGAVHPGMPRGLANTFTPQDEFDTSRLVKTYADPSDTRPLPQDTLGIVGTGGLYATASDLAAFGSSFGDMLSETSVAAMSGAEYQRGVWPEDDADLIAYGLGWDSVKVYPFALGGIQALMKVGDTQFYHAALVIIPEYSLSAGVLTSGGSSVYNLLAANQMLIAVLAERGITVTQEAPALPEAAAAAMPEGLTDFSGYYGSFSQQMEVTITPDGKLTIHSLTVPSAPNQEFYYHSDGSFRDATGQAALVKPVTEENGVTYLYQKAWSELPGLGLLPTSNYLAQKLPDNKVTPQVQAAWDTLGAMPTVPVNMKYTSQLYVTLFSSAAAAAAQNPEWVPGYLGALRIVDETTARNELRIPNQGSRDSQDMTIYETDGVTCYTTNQGIVYADAAKVAQSIYAGGGAYCTVGENGWARWYEVGEKAAGRTMTVQLPENAGFYVYNADGTVAYSSVAYGDTAAVLPEGGSIVFAGAPGSRFYLAFH